MVKRIIKLTVFCIALLLVAPLLLLTVLEGLSRRGSGIFRTCAQLVAIVPGPVGDYVRAAYYFGALESCSWETHIGFGSLFTRREARVGKNVSSGNYCVFGHASIGAGARIASRVSIPSGKRQHLDDQGQLSDESFFTRVSIGPDVWIGEGATILADVGERSIVSAGAVVIDAMPGGYIIAGNPAKPLKPVDVRDSDDGAS